jgi:hypothetical protein
MQLHRDNILKYTEGRKSYPQNPNWDFSGKHFEELKKYSNFRIDAKMELPPLVPIVIIDDQPISTAGNITVFSGASKSGKSAFMNCIVAGAISADGVINDPLPGLYVEPNRFGMAVIHIDTEQSKHKHYANVKSILRRADLAEMPENFCSYNIRMLDIANYKNVTSGICEEANSVFGGIHCIVIDGIADYITDVNCVEQSNSIIKYFEKLAITYNCPVLTIVHTNPGTDKERGHLGSQLQRKCESLIIVRADGDCSYLDPKFLRNAGLGRITRTEFAYDEDKGYHVAVGVREQERVDKKAERLVQMANIAEAVLSESEGLKYGELTDKITTYTKMSISTVKGYVTLMKANSIIVQIEDGRWVLPVTK